ncbi:MAG: hypothetical protein ACPGPE_01420 [Planctomycetota bacterium]|jgi:hypothetical protein
MRSLIPSISVTCGLFAAVPAPAQVGVNFDFGPAAIHGVPGSDTGAAAQVGGHWNGVDTDALASASLPLTLSGFLDASGASTPVTLVVNDLGTGVQSFLFDDPSTSGGDDALLDDLAFFGGAATIEIRGLAAGQYDVLTYAAVPSGASYRTRVRVPSSPDPLQDVGGDFSGGYQLGVTHARHAVDVAPGSAVTLQLNVAADFMSLNGIQIVPFGATGDLGSRYCSPGAANSTGLPGEVSAFGSPRRVDNDVALTASSLPSNTFGFFLTSRTQGFTATPGGSVGNLCLGGAIGRYVGAGQILNSGSIGAFTLFLDLAATPTPTGLVSVATGETWHFQAWYRDAFIGIPISNLTDGLALTFL